MATVVIIFRFVLKPKIVFALFVAFLDIIFFINFNPTTIASFGLVVGFSLLLLTLYCVFFGIFALIAFYIRFLKSQRRRLALFCTCLAGVLLALLSTGQFSIHDMFVVIPLGIVFYIYLTAIRTRQIKQT